MPWTWSKQPGSRLDFYIKKESKNFDSIFDVIPERLERSTHSLEGCCSIQLSYGTRTEFQAAKIHFFSTITT